MQETIELFEKTPEVKGLKAKALHLLLSYFLSYGYIIIALITWWQTQWYMALSALLFSYLIIAIIASKLLHSYIPNRQQEFTYSSKDIAAWVIHYYFFDNNDVGDDLTI
jgi:hypothetical protein